MKSSSMTTSSGNLVGSSSKGHIWEPHSRPKVWNLQLKETRASAPGTAQSFESSRPAQEQQGEWRWPPLSCFSLLYIWNKKWGFKIAFLQVPCDSSLDSDSTKGLISEAKKRGSSPEMTSKSCFLQHKSPFENAELAGKGNSILPSKWLNFAWKKDCFLKWRSPSSSNSLYLRRKWKFKGHSFPKAITLAYFPLAFSKKFSLFFPESCEQWLPDQLWLPVESQGGHFHFGCPHRMWQRHHACQGCQLRGPCRCWSLKWCGSWGREWFHFPLPMK